MGLFDYVKKNKKKQGEGEGKGAGETPVTYTEEQVQQMLEDERKKFSAQEGMSPTEMATFTSHCAKLGATDIQKTCIESKMNYVDAMNALMTETITMVDEVTKDVNHFNPNAGNQKFDYDTDENGDKKESYLSVVEAIPNIARKKKVSFVQAKEIAMTEYPHLFLNPFRLENKGRK